MEENDFKQKKTMILDLRIMSRAEYDKFIKFQHLIGTDEQTIWAAYPKTGAASYDSNKEFNEASILEFLLLCNKILTKYKYKYDLEFWYLNSTFICNNKLFKIDNNNNSIVELDIKNTLIISFRDTWNKGYFQLLENIFLLNNSFINKPNKQTMLNNGCLNKFYSYNSFIKNNQTEKIGDFIIPNDLVLNYTDDIFIEHCIKFFDKKFVLKIDCIQEGKGIYFFNFVDEENYQSQFEKLKNILEQYKHKDVILLKDYKIKNEYRCYFTRNPETALFKVHSIKTRSNINHYERHLLETFQVNKNIKINWGCLTRRELLFHKIEEIAINEFLQYLDFDTGCMEFIITEDNELVFMEVNQMAGPLPFEGEDTDGMIEFYNTIIKNNIIGLEDYLDTDNKE